MKKKLRNEMPLGNGLYHLGRCKIGHWLLMLMVCLMVNSLAYEAQAQGRTVSGKVVGAQGEGLAGVTVLVKGTSNGASTDANGNFTISLASGQENGTLVVSYIGFTSQEVPIAGQSSINITLQPDEQTLNEVVVIGYQTVRKSDLTGAVSVVSPEAASRVSANSVAESIQGLTPGVTVRTEGVPGANARIEIRGTASFLNTDPLYVIDGMIADANTTINNNDIASIQVLKDASAAAIYGARAANGVVIITTKQGKEGPAKVSFSAKYGVQQIPKRWDVMNASEFAAMQRMQYQNSNRTPLPSVAEGTFNPAINTDWQDESLQNGSLQDYNVSLSGGTATSNYLISGSYFRNEGFVKATSFDRGSLRVNTSSQKGRVTFGENMVLTNSIAKSPGEGNPIYDMAIMLPVIPVRDPSYITPSNPDGYGIGSTSAVTYAFNPVAVRNYRNYRTEFAKLVGNAYIDVKLVDWLSYKFNVGLEVSFDHLQRIRKTGVYQFNATSYPSEITEDRSRYLSTLFEHTLNFNKTFGDHSINGVVGISQQQAERQYTAGGRTNLLYANGQYYTTIGAATGTASAGGGLGDDYKIFGYLGRVNYSFKDRYLLTLTGRVDEDSRFGANYRRGFFPSVAASWRISEENFFNAPWVSDLKLNASYGKLGIVVPNLGSWPYTAYINNSPRAIFGTDQTPYIGAYAARLANPDLHWEERVQQNLGIDASFLNNRVSLEFNVYNSLSRDAILDLDVPGYLGNLQGNPFINTASIRNKGFEIAATYRSSTTSDFRWDVSANATTIKNKVEEVGQGVSFIQTGNARSAVGRPVGEWYVIRTDGIFQNQDEINRHVSAEGTVIQPYAKPGDIRFIDKNGDGQINNDDRDFAGSPWPSLQAGGQFNASYKQFSLNVQLVGVFDYTIYNDVRRALDIYQNTNFRSDLSPWSPTNTNTSDPRIGLETDDQGIISNNRAESDRWLEEASYLRFRNVELGYELPASLLTRARISNARLFVSGQNLFTITNYSGLDPDVTGGIRERGLDNGHWPSPRVISVGIQAGF
ncbi:SusC/RagA family TonB-linked outer membrane protein [Rufibacter aurantiacus]|uniref:SusC/RagA family TonB-linked outer membrane protein n=1 Tax=Rufibacter aurantiacus TaxID=2817374 RepID=UPI001B30456A|nr:TonB-dependent receptor [Rufibacter aurantiacus]